jgi:hypothetical protein
MSFPFANYDAVLSEAKSIIEDRIAKGRNTHVPFWETRCHGSQDVSGELWQRITRILGAEKRGDRVTLRQDAIDLVNEAIFLVMFLDREPTTADTSDSADSNRLRCHS